MTPNQCSKCSGTDVVVRLVENRQLINHSGRQRIETEFITSDEYDFYWKHTAAKEHLSKYCRSCQHSWRENIVEQAKSDPAEPVSREAVEAVEPVAIANKGDCAFWVKWTDAGKDLRGPGIKLYTAPPSPDWREHSRHIAKGEQCPETLDTLQAAWARDQELIDDMRHEIARHKTRINRLEQRRSPSPDAELVSLLREIHAVMRGYFPGANPLAHDQLMRCIDAKLANSERVKS
jgi:hypothetical protein